MLLFTYLSQYCPGLANRLGAPVAQARVAQFRTGDKCDDMHGTGTDALMHGSDVNGNVKVTAGMLMQSLMGRRRT